ncbi:PAS domain S-box protein [Gramella sp. GC03-9]|uniref:histidine kinase n=1 Tax=Christiangramia oceanisediminis TaxID=2920386 RepID=A0A9X2RDU1_9FLAO|nr:PAS domain S-box protein [Gramella oceanisediminis]MCP9200876.1 PAS domain S-box protein [Gramella oceanisediminis]
MAIKRLINKFTFLSILFLSLIISSQFYFADREAARIHDELNADLISGKVTNLLFLLNGDESLRSDWEEQYKDLLITLNNYPDLRRLILKNLESLNHSIENFSFQDRSFNSTEASRAGNHLIIKDILKQLDNYSYQTSQRLLKLQRDSLYMELSLILVFTIFFLYNLFIFLKSNYRSFNLLLAEILSVKEGKTTFINLGKAFEKDRELSLIGNLLNELLYKLDENRKQLLSNFRLLEERNHFIEEIFNHLPIGASIYSISEKRFIKTNVEFARIYGWNPVSIENLDSFFDYLKPGSKYQKQIENSILEDTNNSELRMIEIKNEQGETRYINIKRIPIPEQDLVVLTAIDITERKKAEKRIREQEEYLQILTQNASDAILACDSEGRIVFFNNMLRSWAGNERSDISPEDWPGHYHLYTSDLGRHLRTDELSLVKALKSGRVKNHEFAMKKPGNPVRYLEANGSALYSENGHKMGAMVVLRDITERVNYKVRISNEIIEAREKERKKIASELHDGITQYLGLIAMNLKNLGLDFPQLQDNNRYKSTVSNLEEVINASRNLAHRIMPGSIEYLGLIPSVEELLENLQLNSSIQINFVYNKDIKLASNLELQLFRIIQETVGNALKHSKASLIQVSITIQEKDLLLEVEDNGIGFDPGENFKVGIGLLTIKDRVKKIEGKLDIISDQNGTKLIVKSKI